MEETSLNIPRTRTPQKSLSNKLEPSRASPRQLRHSSRKKLTTFRTPSNGKSPMRHHLSPVRWPHDPQSRSHAQENSRRFTPRTPAAQLRSVASVPALKPTKRVLRYKGSKLDLLETKLTSFPEPEPREEKPAEQQSLHIIDNYIPRMQTHEALLDEPEVEEHDEGWTEFLWKKLRWRWRLQGLV